MQKGSTAFYQQPAATTLLFHFYMIILWRILFCSCLLHITNSNGELSQLTRYVNCINSGGNFISTSQCVHNFYKNRSFQGNPPRYCRHALIPKNNQSRIETKAIIQSKNFDYIVNFTTPVQTIDHNYKFNLTIIPYYVQLLQPGDVCMLHGGSSFLVSVEFKGYRNNVIYVWCGSTYVNNMYNLQCGIPLSVVSQHILQSKTSSRLNFSLRDSRPLDIDIDVSVTVDYENYNAFDDNNALVMQPMNIVIAKNSTSILWDNDLLLTTNQTHNFNGQQNITVSNYTNSHLCMLTNFNSSAIDSSKLRTKIYFVGSSHMRYLYDSVVLSQPECIPHGREYIQSLPQHHGYAQIAGLQYVPLLFTLELPSLLNDLCADVHDALQHYDETYSHSHYARAKSNNNLSRNRQADIEYYERDRYSSVSVVVAIESLAWDLDYLPARNVLQYNASSVHVIDTLRDILVNRECGRYMEVVWLTAVPVPVCLTHNSTTTYSDHKHKRHSHQHEQSLACSWSGRGYRNNHAIAALNEYFTRELKAIQTSIMSRKSLRPIIDSKAVKTTKENGIKRVKHSALSVNNKSDFTTLVSPSSLRILDAFQLIYPYHSEHVCGLHFTCVQRVGKGKEVKLVQTTGGILVLSELLYMLN